MFEVRTNELARLPLSLAAAFYYLVLSVASCEESAPDGSRSLPVPTEKPRIVISTDLGGSDEDDVQSLIHYLTYADRFDTEGFISSPPGDGRSRDIQKVIDAYAHDWQWLNCHSRFPHARTLKPLVKQGAVDPAPPAGISAPTEGSEWIIERARDKSDSRPLWILVWGSITDVAQALHDAPDIAPNIRVHFIASWNRRQDPHSFAYIDRNFPDLFMIQNETTFRGWYQGGEQHEALGNRSFIATHARGHGALGDLLALCHAGGVPAGTIKMGDTPTVSWFLRGNPNVPTEPHWGGRFEKLPNRPNWFVDITDPAFAEGRFPGAKTVNRWRKDYLLDWEERLDWLHPVPENHKWSHFEDMPGNWYSSADARATAASVISHQGASGGWSKNLGTFQFPYHGPPELIISGFDNSATTGEIRFLANYAKRTGDPLAEESCRRGIRYVLDAQSKRTGGWSQEYPTRDTYGQHITYNDDAFINALKLSRDIAERRPPFNAAFIPMELTANCAAAVERGVECILHTQIIQSGMLTGWCAQHDKHTLLPCGARTVEPPSVSGQESAGALNFLMNVKDPSPEIVDAVYSAAEWYRQQSMHGYDYVRDSEAGWKLLRVSQPDARPLWPRFIEFGTNRAVFLRGDGKVFYSLPQLLNQEKRNYRWYSTRMGPRLDRFERWVRRHPVRSNRLMRFPSPERPFGPNRMIDQTSNHEVAVRDYSAVANVSIAKRIDYPPAHTSEESDCKIHVIVCCDGDYRHLRLRAAHQLASAIAATGIPVTILKYRTPLSLAGHRQAEANPLTDLQELLLELRNEKAKGTKLVAYGHGAGGHLALTAAVHATPDHLTPDLAVATDSPIDASIPNRWFDALLGADSTNNVLRDFWTPGIHVTDSTCPIVLSHSPEHKFRADAIALAERVPSAVSMDEVAASDEVPAALDYAIKRLVDSPGSRSP